MKKITMINVAIVGFVICIAVFVGLEIWFIVNTIKEPTSDNFSLSIVCGLAVIWNVSMIVGGIKSLLLQRVRLNKNYKEQNDEQD